MKYSSTLYYFFGKFLESVAFYVDMLSMQTDVYFESNFSFAAILCKALHDYNIKIEYKYNARNTFLGHKMKILPHKFPLILGRQESPVYELSKDKIPASMIVSAK